MDITRREAIKWMTVSATAVAGAPLHHLWADAATAVAHVDRYPYRLPELPYAFDALADFIDPETVEIHYTRHHAAYVNNLNKALSEYPEWQTVTLEELLARMGELPDTIRTTVRNNGGGHANHNLYWEVLIPAEDRLPGDVLAGMIEKDFGSQENLLEQLRKASLSVFGSGWAWLSLRDGKLLVETTPNQDSPLMKGHRPLVGIDVWEHAYYLRYQNRRADYVVALLEHINWKHVARSLSS